MQVSKAVATLAPLWATIAGLSIVSSAAACPFCAGGPSGINEVNLGIFNDTFWLRAAAVLAPFPILIALVALIYFWPQPPSSGKHQRT